MKNRLFRNLTEAGELITRAQVAELLCVSPSTVTRWADEGKLTCVRTLGGHRRYQRREIVEISDIIYSEIEPDDKVSQEVSMERIQVEIPRLYGDHHATAVRQVLAQVPGIQQVWTSPARRQVKVDFDPEQVDAETIAHRLARAGYPVRNGQVDAEDHRKDPGWATLEQRMTQTYHSGA